MWEHFVAVVGNPLRKSDSPDDPMVKLVVDIARHQREHIVRKALGGRVDPLFLNFVLVMNKHDRLGIIRPVAAVYRGLIDERARKMRVQVLSAVPLNDAERSQIKEMARRRWQLDPVLVEKVDPAVLGGVRLQVGDRMIDATVRARLDGIKNQLLARSSHAIGR
jgi:F-type H+-transporting ATPase subunit delta